MKVRLGTRGSPLAWAQSCQVAEALKRNHPDLEVEMVRITTTGDRLQQAGVKGAELTKAIFTKEIEEALLRKEIDLAVHSAKDLAADMPPGLILAAVPVRAAWWDVLISRDGLDHVLALEAPLLATGSVRRRRQWQERQPGVRWADLRGNIDTRLRRLRESTDWDGIVLAAAGLERLGPDLSGLRVDRLPMDWMLPAPGQGALALQVRENDGEVLKRVRVLNDPDSQRALEAERALLRALGAGCRVPLGALAEVKNQEIHLRAVFYVDGAQLGRRAEARGGDGLALGREVAHKLSE